MHRILELGTKMKGPAERGRRHWSPFSELASQSGLHSSSPPTPRLLLPRPRIVFISYRRSCVPVWSDSSRRLPLDCLPWSSKLSGRQRFSRVLGLLSFRRTRRSAGRGAESLRGGAPQPQQPCRQQQGPVGTLRTPSPVDDGALTVILVGRAVSPQNEAPGALPLARAHGGAHWAHP